MILKEAIEIKKYDWKNRANEMLCILEKDD